MCALKRNMGLALILVSLLLIPLAGAATDSASVIGTPIYEAPEDARKLAEEGDFFSELCINAELYNRNFDEMPVLLKQFVGSQDIAGQIKLENGTMLNITLSMRGAKVMDFYSYDTLKDPKLKLGASAVVETDEATVRKIMDSEEPFKEAVNYMNDGSLSVECEGMFRKAALWTIKKLY